MNDGRDWRRNFFSPAIVAIFGANGAPKIFEAPATPGKLSETDIMTVIRAHGVDEWDALPVLLDVMLFDGAYRRALNECAKAQIDNFNS